MSTHALSDPLHLSPDAWDSHPNYPRQTLLLASHANFRRISRSLIRRVRIGADAGPIAGTFRSWKAAMRGHEHYEEYKLYPYLTWRWGLDFSVCEAGHRELAERDADVRTALADTDPPTHLLADALEAHDAVLLAHLALEESLVMPALLALRPEEFDVYTRSELRDLVPAPHSARHHAG